jgi:hypothetical protein
VAGVWYLFDPKARVKLLQFACRFKGHNAVIPDHQQDWDVSRAHQPAIVRVGRRKNIERMYSGFQPGRGYEFDELRPAVRVPDPCLREHVSPVHTEKSAVLLDGIALVHLALALRTQKSGVREDDAANGRGELTRDYGRGHTPHRMAQHNGSLESEPLDESDDIARVILVSISIERRARIPVAPGIGHHHIVFTFESARQGSPAGSAPGQSVEKHQWGLGLPGSQVVNVDAVGFADPGHPVRHGNQSLNFS